MNFSVNVQVVQSAVVVTPGGELDIASAPLLREALEAALRQRCRHVVVDLNQLTFIDSSGIGALLDQRRRSLEVGTRFSVACADQGVLQILELTGLRPVLDPQAKQPSTIVREHM